jgi:rifampin ADP-ribosylating transferase
VLQAPAHRLQNRSSLSRTTAPIDAGPFYHDCKADLKTGDQLVHGFLTNYGKGKSSNFIYSGATLEASI